MKTSHKISEAERRQLIEQGRAVGLGSCAECGVVELSPDNLDAKGHRVDVTHVVARGDVKDMLDQLAAAPDDGGAPAR